MTGLAAIAYAAYKTWYNKGASMADAAKISVKYKPIANPGERGGSLESRSGAKGDFEIEWRAPGEKYGRVINLKSNGDGTYSFRTPQQKAEFEQIMEATKAAQNEFGKVGPFKLRTRVSDALGNTESSLSSLDGLDNAGNYGPATRLSSLLEKITKAGKLTDETAMELSKELKGMTIESETGKLFQDGEIDPLE